MFATPLECDELAFDTALSESGGNHNSVQAAEFFIDVCLRDFLRMDVDDIDLVVKICGGLHQTFVDRFVCILKFHVFTDETYIDDFLCVCEFMQENVPSFKIRFRSRIGFCEAEDSG